MLPSDELTRTQALMRACIQCGTCSASCPNEFAMDATPRQLWRMLLLGRTDDIFNSRTFALCSDCYCCTLRCPRGLPATEAMEALKRMAAAGESDRYRRHHAFYKSFLKGVRRRGRVNETELMGTYFLRLRSPLAPLRFLPLGLKLTLKGKVSPMPPLKRKTPLDALFGRVAELEEGR
jgi:heterodisulfide reductase subunit C